MRTWGEVIDQALALAEQYRLEVKIELESRQEVLLQDRLLTHLRQGNFGEVELARNGVTIKRQARSAEQMGQALDQLTEALEALYGGDKKAARDRLLTDASDAPHGEAS